MAGVKGDNDMNGFGKFPVSLSDSYGFDNIPMSRDDEKQTQSFLSFGGECEKSTQEVPKPVLNKTSIIDPAQRADIKQRVDEKLKRFVKTSKLSEKWSDAVVELVDALGESNLQSRCILYWQDASTGTNTERSYTKESNVLWAYSWQSDGGGFAFGTRGVKFDEWMQWMVQCETIQAVVLNGVCVWGAVPRSNSVGIGRRD